MRAIICTQVGGEELLEYRSDWPAATCGPQPNRIRIEAASVNFPDSLIIRGLYPHKPELPFVPGSECSGVVSEVGAEGRR